ncbi:MAG: serine hydrolase domain-containing protein [Armatimonadota bacterium]
MVALPTRSYTSHTIPDRVRRWIPFDEEGVVRWFAEPVHRGAETMLQAPFRELDRFVDQAVAEGIVPGGAVLVARGGDVLHRHVRGTRAGLAGPAVPLEPGTRHPFYSFSKLVGATVVARLVDEGRLAWDEPVARRLPEFGRGGKQGITLRHLLSHAAGIPSVPLGNVPDESAWQTAWRTACSADMEWEPGSRTAYHALSGLFVAACLARDACGGATWESICRERLFEPIGAETLTYDALPDSVPVAWVPQPKDPRPKSNRDALPFHGHPGAGCTGTLEDAAKVLRLHLDDGVLPGGRRWLSRASVAAMHTLQHGPAIRRALAAGRTPAHEPWGLGPLLRGEGPSVGAHGWFGFGTQTTPGLFGHVGIDTFLGVDDPVKGVAVVFGATHSPATSDRTVALRGGVVDRALAAAAD